MQQVILLTFGETLGGHVVDCHLIPLDHVFGIRFALSDEILDDARPDFSKDIGKLRHGHAGFHANARPGSQFRR